MGTVRAREAASLSGAGRSENPVARPHLVRLLARALDAPLTLIVAPMGYGKTAAVREFLATRSAARPATVVEVPADGGGSGSFWDAVLGHMAAAWPDIALPAAAGDVRRLLPLLHERTAAVDEPLVVVLDDLHRLRDRALLTDLAYLVDRLPPALRLVATARRLPALPVGRWRAQGQVAEITTDDLRFRPHEVATLLGTGDAGAGADDGTVWALTERSEGWVAGLRLLAALPDPRAPLDPAAAEALLDEVLADHPPDVEDFLLTTSLLGRFSADLCRVVTGRADAGTMLHDVEAANLFVVALDDQGDWFRYQRLFAELLRQRLDRRTTSARHLERQRALHRSAAAWFETDGKTADAVAHHVRAGDVDRAFSLLDDDVDVFARDPQVQAIDWEAMFPAAWLEADPRRMIWFAALLAPTGGGIERMGDWLDRAEEALASREPDATGADADADDAYADDARALRGLDAAVRAYWWALRCDADRTLEWGRRALDLLDDRVTAHVLARRVQISMLAAHVLIDDLDEADHLCDRLDGPEVPEIVRSLLIPGYRARLALRRGQLVQAEGLARLVRRAAGAMGVPLHLGVRDVNVALAGVLAERGEWDSAAELLDDALAMTERRRWQGPALITEVERVRLHAAVAGPAAALARIDDLRTTIATRPVGPDAVAAVDALEATLLLAVGDTGVPQRVAELVGGLRPGIRRRLLEVRLALATGELDRAATLLEAAGPDNLRDRLVVDLLTARRAAAAGDAETRDLRLRAAADRARAQGFRRIFLDEAPELVPALRALAERRTELRPVVDEIEALASGPGPGRAEALTERESAVLRYLQSRLTQHEIAAELGISTNTLKTHARALYRKLGATSRTEALDAATRAGLLQPRQER